MPLHKLGHTFLPVFTQKLYYTTYNTYMHDFARFVILSIGT